MKNVGYKLLNIIFLFINNKKVSQRDYLMKLKAFFYFKNCVPVDLMGHHYLSTAFVITFF